MTAGRAAPAGAAPEDGGSEPSGRFTRGIALSAATITCVWHATIDTVNLAATWSEHRSQAGQLAAWLAVAALAAVGTWILVRSPAGEERPGASRADTARICAVLALLAGVLAGLSAPHGDAIGVGGWAWSGVGWLGVLFLLFHPLRELIAFLAAHLALTAGVLLADGVLDGAMAPLLAVNVITTSGVFLSLRWVAGVLARGEERARAAVRDRAAVLARARASDELHAGRGERYAEVREGAGAVLAGLAGGRLDAAAPEVRQLAALEAARLRRLFAESDDAPDPLLHELRACADVATVRGVLVDIAVVGEPPELPPGVRRALVEAPMRALATARAGARVTVAALPGELAVAVVADCDPAALAQVSRAVLSEEGSGSADGIGDGGRPGGGGSLRSGRRNGADAAGADGVVSVTIQAGEAQCWVEARWSRPGV
ncbi:hypothetical protein [Allonocardiopsis opalescens]|uniref:Signal transduction histidine kinase n=1 Tax=Allonocardiopsis opalescens TaxID=1144618 RepID=A0A2T0PVT2_9ACTN|nr:hypothetical protein [Allonocardiopsis opalescens]PRX95468.1 hypothetical protein CLV72_10976 [Allonocardiopsis opalescens]